MKSFTEAKQAYIDDHLSRPLKQPSRRINALAAIENVLLMKEPDLLIGNNLFTRFEKNAFKVNYEKMKGKALSSAEISVINWLYKFAFKQI